MCSIYTILLPGILFITYQDFTVADWTVWSTCSKPCDVGIQSRTRLYNGTNRIEQQYCNLQYCPDKGVSCLNSGRLGCTQFGGYADCKYGQCVCRLGKDYHGSTTYDYNQYYNAQNCFPEVGNCIIREDPPFALAKVETLDYGYKLRSCVTNDNPLYEVHVIGVYERNSYSVIIRPRGETNKSIILVLLSYHKVTWRIDTTVPIDSIVYSILRSDSYEPVRIIGRSKCGSAKIIRFDDLRYSTGTDTGGGNTPKILLTLENIYGPVTSFNGVYTLYGPATMRLQVGGNPLLLSTNAESKEYDRQCLKVSPQYSNMTFTGTVVPPVLPQVTPANDSSLTVVVPTIMACAGLVTLICIIFVIVKARKRANGNLRAYECPTPQSFRRETLCSYAVMPASYSGTSIQSIPLDGWASNIDSASTHEFSAGNTHAHASTGAPPSYESVAGTKRQPVNLSYSITDSTGNQSFTESRNNETTLNSSSFATTLPPSYESYIAMQHKQT